MSQTIEVHVPDIGDFAEVEVIEILVKPGDSIAAEQSLVTVESDKASMEIPSAAAGIVRELRVKLGDKVAKGSLLLMLEPSGAGASASGAAPSAAAPAPAAKAPVAAVPSPAAAAPVTVASVPAPAAAPAPLASAAIASGAATSAVAPVSAAPSGASAAPTAALGGTPNHVVKPHASPSVRRFARELGVDLAQVRGTGPKQRILQSDVQAWIKETLARAASGASAALAPAAGDSGAGLGLIAWPKVDFAKFGAIERQPRSRIKKLSAANLHRNWVMIPHVTNHDDADITELEAFRVRLNEEHAKAGAKVTMLAFLIKACVSALKKFPEFNASLDGDDLVLKRHYHIGFAADTPNGLVVPVIRDADQKGILQLARESAELAAKARDGKLSPADMQGGTFSISSLGGIGGTYFTPIINAPEVAILGVCRSSTRPVWNGQSFEPRLILPLSLSWDHRVIDGAAAARFNVYLAQLLADFRRVML
jgi:pyruvate dehydrogenase E2 component (dihydrolipoamide acetyltransferase)